VVSFDEQDGEYVRLASGEQVHGDVIIAAGGSEDIVRKALLEEEGYDPARGNGALNWKCVTEPVQAGGATANGNVGDERCTSYSDTAQTGVSDAFIQTTCSTWWGSIFAVGMRKVRRDLA
jgi:hypothetical protein